jgi:hypothetical protein
LWIELGCVAGEVDGVSGGLVQNGEAGLSGRVCHYLLTVGASIDVTVAASHVAELAKVKL